MKAEKTAEQILNSHFSRPRSPDFERNVLAVMEEYAQSRTEQLQKEVDRFKNEAFKWQGEWMERGLKIGQLKQENERLRKLISVPSRGVE